LTKARIMDIAKRHALRRLVYGEVPTASDVQDAIEQACGELLSEVDSIFERLLCRTDFTQSAVRVKTAVELRSMVQSTWPFPTSDSSGRRTEHEVPVETEAPRVRSGLTRHTDSLATTNSG